MFNQNNVFTNMKVSIHRLILSYMYTDIGRVNLKSTLIFCIHINIRPTFLHNSKKIIRHFFTHLDGKSFIDSW